MEITKEQFKEVRKRLSLSTTAYADLLGYSSRKTIEAKEKGIRSITARDVENLSGYFTEDSVINKPK